MNENERIRLMFIVGSAVERFQTGPPLYNPLTIPARTPSAIKPRSSSATAPSIVKTVLPGGVLVSGCSDREKVDA